MVRFREQETDQTPSGHFGVVRGWVEEDVPDQVFLSEPEESASMVYANLRRMERWCGEARKSGTTSGRKLTPAP